jgi:phosphoribosylaminoimidazolecarboxamide formyltransferase/IMP cyclohydrolase
MQDVVIKRALLSVSDKAGLVELGHALAARHVELVSTGGTAKTLRDAGLQVKDISELTGFPEMMDGRVKTLHPKVHGGLLAVRDNAEHAASMKEHDIGAIDLVVVNLYPFAQTVAKGASRDEIIENIDIGGPSMVRSAAKNHAYVTILTDPSDYDNLIAELEESGGKTSYDFRRKCAAKAYSATAAYDSMISQWFAFADQQQLFPDMLAVNGNRETELRYGENPHQRAALYLPVGPHGSGIAQAEQVQGKELSYNNYNDADAALELVSEFRDGPPTVVIVKHANPCGVATGETLIDAYRAALERGGLSIKPITGGLLVQSRDNGHVADSDFKVVTKRAPSVQELADCRFAWTVAKHVKSNAIVYAKDGATAGIGAGQMNRRDSARIAAIKATEAAETYGWATPRTVGSAVASDAFFPFADGLLAAAEAGATAVIQPGGSMRDDEVIAAADAAGLAMVFTGMRHFRH